MAHVRIGVTGHRTFLHLSEVVTALDAVLERVVPKDADVTVVSSLAEGADRLVAEVVLTRPRSRLEAVLPFPGEEYSTDFASEDARDEFSRLVARADHVDVIDPGDGSREDADQRAGRAVVDRSDVLIALWDGQPARGRAGCAEIVQYALDHDHTVEIVLVERERGLP